MVILTASDAKRCGSFTLNDDGNRYVPNLNENDDRRYLDNNWFDNEWNASNRFLFASNSLHVSGRSIGPSLRV